MIVKSKLTEKDFINVNFLLIWQKAFVRIFAIVLILLGVLRITTSIIAEGFSFADVPVGVLIIPFVYAVFIYFISKKGFSSNPRSSEMIEYGFYMDKFSVKGETFSSTLSWQKMNKVTKTKNWLLVWQSSQAANPIPLKYFDQLQLDELKEILYQNKVKNNL